jgi:hypothetical protein
MNRCRSSSLLFLLCLLLLCSAAQATVDLQITVRDSIDNTSIPNAVVYVNGQDVARTNNNGQYFLSHNGLSDQRIRISVTGYEDWENIIAKNNEILLVNLSRKTVTLKINLYDSDTLGPVAGAHVNVSALNSTQSKQSDSAGAVAFLVNASMLYSVDIEAPGYEPRSSTASVGMENKAVQFWLLSGNKYSFVVKDKESRGPVQGAEIRLNAILAGKTDERGILSTPVARGKDYTIEIRKDGYEPLTESRTISQADALYTAEIKKAPIGAFVFVYDENNSPINGADIYINGNLSGTTNQNGRHTFPDLVFGSYPVEVKKTGYIPSNRTLIVSNKSEDYTFTLSFEGSDLTISVKDKNAAEIPNASVAINGAVSGQTDNHGEFTTKVKFNQIYNITASHDGYQSSSVEKQVIQGNATGSVTINLEKTMDWGFLEIIVIVVIVVLVLFAAFRKFGKKPVHHVMRRNEI